MWTSTKAVRILALMCAPLWLNACSNFTDRREKGVVWCNEAYLDDKTAEPVPHEQITQARQGYVYALAAAWVLQTEKDKDRHYFDLPGRMRPEDEPDAKLAARDGFLARTILLYDGPSDNEASEVIIAFAGSNDGGPRHQEGRN
jgi:hypothetical protein